MRSVFLGIKNENAGLVCFGYPSGECVELGPTVVSVIIHFLGSKKGPHAYPELLDLSTRIFVEPRTYLGP